MLGDNADLDHLEDGKGEGGPPEDPTCCLNCGDVDHRVVRAVLQHPDDQAHKEQRVGDDVVRVPKGEVSLLEPSPVGGGPFEVPEKERSPDVSETVRGDEDGKQPVDPVDVGILRLGDLDDDEADEADVGEGGVDGPVEGHPPLLAEPGGGGRLVALGGEEARIEERVEEEQEVAGHLQNEIKQKSASPLQNFKTCLRTCITLENMGMSIQMVLL